MTTYIVTYQVASDDIRDKLRKLMKGYDNYCPIHRYCWAIQTDKTPRTIRDELGTVLEPADRLFVIRSGMTAAWKHTYGEKNNEWLKENL